jgi:hypothetical protein
MLYAIVVLRATVAPSDSGVEDTPALHWQAPSSECGGPEALQRDVEVILGRAPPSSVVRVAGTATRTPGGWTMELVFELDGEVRRKTLSATACDSLRQAAALVVAFAVDPPSGSEDGTEPPSASDEPRSAPPAVTPQPEKPHPLRKSSVAPEPTPSPRRVQWRPSHWSGTVGVGAQVSIGRGPRWSIGPAVSVGVQRGAFGLQLHGRYEPPQATRARQGASALVQIASATALGCATPRIRDFQFPLCLGAEAGVLRAEGLGTRRSRVVLWPWLAAAASAQARWWFHSRWGVGLDVEVTVPVVHPQVRVRRPQTGGSLLLHESARVGGRGQVDVLWRFGAKNRSRRS